MENIIFRILLSIAIFTLLTIPHLIYMMTHLKHGFAYPWWIMVLLGAISSIISKYVADFLET